MSVHYLANTCAKNFDLLIQLPTAVFIQECNEICFLVMSAGTGRWLEGYVVDQLDLGDGSGEDLGTHTLKLSPLAWIKTSKTFMLPTLCRAYGYGIVTLRGR